MRYPIRNPAKTYEMELGKNKSPILNSEKSSPNESRKNNENPVSIIPKVAAEVAFQRLMNHL